MTNDTRPDAALREALETILPHAEARGRSLVEYADDSSKAGTAIQRSVREINSACARARAALAAAPAAVGWIACSERMPARGETEDTWVLAWHPRFSRPRLLNYCHGGAPHWRDENDDRSYCDVTHWQPAPAPPGAEIPAPPPAGPAVTEVQSYLLQFAAHTERWGRPNEAERIRKCAAALERGEVRS